MLRKILHADCDCFYAAVEMRENSALANVPLAIGGKPQQRGVIATCNYLARKFGVHSAMASAQAFKICPQLILLPPNFPLYQQVSQEILQIFRELTPIIEPLSLDEAFLDVSTTQLYQNSATRMALALKQRVNNQIGITISVGVASNKFLAKIASDWRKPNGLFVIAPDRAISFIAQLAIDKFPGVGPSTAAKLHQLKIFNGADLQQQNLANLIHHFGKFGTRLYELSRGIDEQEVKINRIRKSISIETTFAKDITIWPSLNHSLMQLIEQFYLRYKKNNQPAISKMFVKIRFNDFSVTTLEHKMLKLDCEQFSLLLREAWQRKPLPIRLIGIGVKLTEQIDYYQFDLFKNQNNS